MALFKMIVAGFDLPDVGSAYEKEHLDFKVRASKSTYELAKDVAAFANHIGGVILVGADDENDRLKCYVPMSQQEAEDCRRSFYAAIKDRCFPAVRCDVEVIAHDGGYVVAANAFPLPDQPVGVKVPVRKEQGDKIDDNAYVFPIRIGTGTSFLKPQELATIMIPALRKAAIDLSHIFEAPGPVVLRWFEPPSTTAGPKFVELQAVDAFRAIAIILVPNAGSPPVRMELPLEAVEAVQRLTDGHWAVSLRGVLVEQGGVWRWDPPR